MIGHGQRGFQILHVNLHHLAAGVGSLVGDGHSHFRAILTCLHKKAGNGKGLIGQAKAKGIQGLLLHIAVGAALHGIVREVRQFLGSAVEGNWQFARGRNLAKEHICHGLAAQCAGVPHIQNGGQPLFLPAKGQRTAGAQHQHHRLAGIQHSFQQGLLAAGQDQIPLVCGTIGVVGVAGLALKLGIQAQAENDYIRELCDVYGLSHTIRPGDEDLIGNILIQRAAFGIIDPYLVAYRFLNAFQHGDIPGGGPIVIAPKNLAAVRIGADNRNAGKLADIQRQNSGILQQYHGLLGSLYRQIMVLFGVIFGIGNLVVFAVIAEHAQAEPSGHQSLAGRGDLFLGHQPFFQRLQHMQIHIAAAHIAAIAQGQGRRFCHRLGHFMILVKILNGAAVRDHMALESPFFPEDFLQQRVAAAGRLPVHPVIGAHNALHIGFLDAGLKSGKIGLLQIFFAHNGVKLVAESLRAAVGGKMLGAGRRLQIPALSLEALNKGHAHTGGEIRVLAIGLMAPAPAGVTENIYVGGPEIQALINVPVTLCHISIVLGAALSGNHIAHLPQQLFIEGSSQSNGLREHGGSTRPGHPVEGLVPPVILGNPQTGDSGGTVRKLESPLFYGHFRHQLLGQFQSFGMGHLFCHRLSLP